jgi:hypothetical protein
VTTPIKDHIPHRGAIVGVLLGLDESGDGDDTGDDFPNIETALDAFLDDLQKGQPFDVALAVVEIAGYLIRQLRRWTGESQQEILSAMAAELTRRTLDRTEGA